MKPPDKEGDLVWRNRLRTESRRKANGKNETDNARSLGSGRAFILFYHTHVLLYLHSRYKEDVRKRLVQKPRILREAELLSKLPHQSWMLPENGWHLCRSYLEVIENQLANILRKHSVFFWLHLYRRISPFLTDEHDGNTDANTVFMVREIAELAIMKYGDLSRQDDLASSQEVKYSDVFGGIYRDLFKRHSRTKTDFMAGFRRLRASQEMVITKFESSDFLDIYEIEGLAYEYWRTSASMRTIGKGVQIKLGKNQWMTYHYPAHMRSLFEWHDNHIRARFAYTLAGNWFGKARDIDDGNPAFSILLPHYNVDHLSSEKDGIRLPGIEFSSDHDFTPNFLISLFQLSSFRQSTEFLRVPFEKKRGFSLDCFLATYIALYNLASFPDQAIMDELSNEALEPNGRSASGMHLLNLSQRGYRAFPAHDIIPSVEERISMFLDKDVAVNQEEIGKCVDFLTLTPERQKVMSLWSKGPQSLVIPFGNTLSVVDMVPGATILERLFVGIKHDGVKRGYNFEQEFRSALSSSGFASVKVGVIENNVGQKREIDASVRIGNTLFLFECISMERPLDYEIGKPRTIRRRKIQLFCKAKQAFSLQKFVSDHPIGRNYDFAWADEVITFVISPFLEWIWSIAPKYWHDINTPRILSAELALDFLSRRRQMIGAVS